MAETVLTKTSGPGKYSSTGAAVVMTAVDNTNGNKWAADAESILIVQNTSGGALSFQMTSQPDARTGRSGSVNQSMAAGEIRVFHLSKDGWQDANGNVLVPSGLNVALKVGIVTLG